MPVADGISIQAALLPDVEEAPFGRDTHAPGGFLVRIDRDSLPVGHPALMERSVPPAVSIQVYGNWQRDELQHVRYRDAELFLFGHCLRNQAWTAQQFAAAMDAGNADAVILWPGSYAAIVRDGRDILAYADLAGQFPVYYGQRDGQTLIGSDPAVLASVHRRSADPLTAAVRIACPDVMPLWSGRSPFQEIHRLEAGRALRAGADFLHTGTREVAAASAPSTLEDATAALRSGLTEGVRARCERRLVSTDFSGGLDSTSIAFLAVRHSERPLPALIYCQPLAPAADLADAVRCSRLSTGLDLMLVRGTEETLPYAALADSLHAGTSLHRAVPRHAEPAAGALTWRASALRLLRASAAQSELHLTGEGADALLMAAPSYLASLARRGSYRTMLRHCGAYGRLRNTSPARLAARAARLGRTDRKAALDMLAAELERPRARPPDWSDAISWWPPCGAAATWLTRSIRQQMAQVAADPVTAGAIAPAAGPADLAALTQLRNSADAQRLLRDLGRRFGMSVHAPFLDSAVVSAAMSVPAVARADPWSYKPLLRSAVAGLVPEEVLSRQTKGNYSAEDYVGVRRALPALRELLRDSRLAALGVIEPTAVAATLQRMSAGVAVPLGPLNMLLATELWLRAAEEDPDRSREPCLP